MKRTWFATMPKRARNGDLEPLAQGLARGGSGEGARGEREEEGAEDPAHGREGERRHLAHRDLPEDGERPEEELDEEEGDVGGEARVAGAVASAAKGDRGDDAFDRPRTRVSTRSVVPGASCSRFTNARATRRPRSAESTALVTCPTVASPARTASPGAAALPRGGGARRGAG